MNGLLSILNQPLPVGVVLLVGILVLWLRVSDLKKSVDGIKANCARQFKWCLEHFQHSDTKGGEIK